MLAFPMKALYFILGLAVAGVAVAYGVGLFDPDPKVASVVNEPGVPKNDRVEQKPAPIASIPAEPKADPASPAAATEVVVPRFDLVRVEPDGSLVVAGTAAPLASVEVVTGTRVLAKSSSTEGGDFVAVLDDRLEPGDYQIVLRSTTADNIVATSLETAIVSIPDTKEGQVLAIVEQPGAPARLITVPATEAAAEPAAPPAPAAPATPPIASGEPPKAPQEAAPAAPEVAANPPAAGNDAATPPAPEVAPDVALAEPKPEAPAKPAEAKAPRIAVEAVEIEGRKIFVAGMAEAGRYVRVYANELLLGEAETSPAGRFLVETERDLAVGDYIIRADMLGDDRSTVIARAAVPFEREAGENVAAVAPPPADSPKEAADKPRPPEQAPATDMPAPAGNAAPPAAADAPKVAEAPQEPAKIPEAPGEPATAMAPRLERSDASVIIRRGDTLWRISRRVYGMGVRYSTIYLANQDQIKNPDRIWPGQVFAMPDQTSDGAKADWEALGDQLTGKDKPAVN
jgi:nucleoid-associated protein YgaU